MTTPAPPTAGIDIYVLLFSAFTVLITVTMGFWAARKSRTTHDFFVAGRSVNVGWNASAISGEYLSAASFMGIAGMVMSSGYDALWYPVCYACGYLFLLLFIAGPLRRFGAYTIPDFAEGRFDSPMFRKIAVIFVLFIGFFYTMPQMKGAGTTLAYIFPGLPYWAGVVLVGLVITLNVALGGMKGITLVQAFQYWAKMFAISVPIFVLMSVYGHYGKQLEQNASGYERKPSEVAAVSRPPKAPADETWLKPFGPLTTKAPKAAAAALAAGSDFSGSLALRAGLAENERLSVNLEPENLASAVLIYEDLTGRNLVTSHQSAAARVDHFLGGRLVKWGWIKPHGRASLISLHRDGPLTASETRQNVEAIFRSHGFIPVGEGNLTFRLLPRIGPLIEAAGNEKNEALRGAVQKAWLKAHERPLALIYTYSLIIAVVCGTAGLPHILVRFYTNPDGIAAKRTTMWVMILIGVFYLFPPIYGSLARNQLPELYSRTGVKGTDSVVLQLPLILNARHPAVGSILSGITCAGAFAAFMSTFSGLLVSMTGALAHDVYGRMLRPSASPAARLRAFKICAVLVGGIAIFLGTRVEALQINFMVGQAFAIAAASYFPLLFMSSWWRGMTMKGAAAGMLGGGLLALAGISLTSFTDLKLLHLDNFWAIHPLARILCEQPAIWAVPLSITLMVIISKITRKEIPADVQEKMLVLHAPEGLGLKQEYIKDHATH